MPKGLKVGRKTRYWFCSFLEKYIIAKWSYVFCILLPYEAFQRKFSGYVCLGRKLILKFLEKRKKNELYSNTFTNMK